MISLSSNSRAKVINIEEWFDGHTVKMHDVLITGGSHVMQYKCQPTSSAGLGNSLSAYTVTSQQHSNI